LVVGAVLGAAVGDELVGGVVTVKCAIHAVFGGLGTITVGVVGVGKAVGAGAGAAGIRQAVEAVVGVGRGDAGEIVSFGLHQRRVGTAGCGVGGGVVGQHRRAFDRLDGRLAAAAVVGHCLGDATGNVDGGRTAIGENEGLVSAVR